MHPTRILRSYQPHGERPNITGFDVRKFVASTGTPRYDPWERSEAWRYRGIFTRWNRFKGAFPGLGIGTAAFVAYCAYEHYFMKDEHHGEGHGEGHH
ncbi:putative nadh:ubiquinone oxidoreductase [Phialemonium atrogriseum]|uniref:Nadh:ubiquinone oxidoreductase n=1 Tax=Phialemonium atrogriseum TaxID=1093897 RepID=A0AAJ0FIQ5_9PEZI|nr:putative nadh:ubiquinone oxidoreductase [Phialemonium atrogriseum]KAK1769092.1 putative nadh:ubiquinone oxidoreductase [Phialemonium atrogriseum]